eukprot:UN25007
MGVHSVPVCKEKIVDDLKAMHFHPMHRHFVFSLLEKFAENSIFIFLENPQSTISQEAKI